MKTPFLLLLVLFSIIIARHTHAQVAPVTYSDDTTAFVHANIITMQTQEAVRDATLLVSHGKIDAIIPGSQPVNPRYKQIDLKGGWVIPGLIDGHIHLNQSGSAFARPDIIDATEVTSYQQEQHWLKENLPEILSNYTRAGVTTVFDMGGPSGWLDYYGQRMKSPNVPTIFAAAELISSTTVPALNDSGPVFLQALSTDEALATITMQANLPVNIAKFVWTGEAGLSPAELAYRFGPAIKAAHDAGLIVAVHAEQLDYAKAAINAGADILVHGVITDRIDEEFITLAKSRGTVYMPTLSAHKHYKDIFLKQLTLPNDITGAYADYVTSSFNALYQNPALTGQMFNVMRKYLPYVDTPAQTLLLTEQEKAIVAQLAAMFSATIERIQKDNLKRAADAGIKLAFGTDAGNPGTLHGQAIFGEMQAWIDAGIPAVDIVTAMTIGNAVAFQIVDKQGSIASGKDASFAVFKENPLTPKLPSKRPVLVVKNGHIVLNKVEKVK